MTKPPRCEAILICSVPHGARCVEPATHQAQGRHVCWTHERAAMNQGRVEALKFIRKSEKTA